MLVLLWRHTRGWLALGLIFIHSTDSSVIECSKKGALGLLFFIVRVI